MARTLVLFVVALILTATSALADTTWVRSGSIAGRWEAAGSPYMLQGHVCILPGARLEIGPGVTVVATGWYRMYIEGQLVTRGTAAAGVVLTADTTVAREGWGGLVFSSAGGTSRLEYTTITGGRAEGFADYGLGGAMLVHGSQVELSFCTIRDCKANFGHAIYARYEADVRLDDCQIIQNGAWTGHGGALCGRYQSQLTLNRCLLEENAALYGGAISLESSTLVLDGCELYKNTAGIWGGGIYSSHSTVTALNTTFSANASIGGGAMDGRSEVRLQMDRCLLLGNAAQRPGSYGPGGGLNLISGQHTVQRSTFVGNIAGDGGAILAGPNTRVKNCIVAGQMGGSGIRFNAPGGDVRFCCFFTNEGGDFAGPSTPSALGTLIRTNVNGDSCDAYWNLFADPVFEDTSTRGYELSGASPCIDAGDPGLPLDPDGTLSDLGAFYFHQTAGAAPGRSDPVAGAAALEPASPNPFNPATTLTYQLAREGLVSLRIYDLLGRDVATLVAGRQPAGSFRVTWNADGQPSGTYLAVLHAGGAPLVQKLVLMK